VLRIPLEGMLNPTVSDLAALARLLDQYENVLDRAHARSNRFRSRERGGVAPRTGHLVGTTNSLIDALPFSLPQTRRRPPACPRIRPPLGSANGLEKIWWLAGPSTGFTEFGTGRIIFSHRPGACSPTGCRARAIFHTAGGNLFPGRGAIERKLESHRNLRAVISIFDQARAILRSAANPVPLLG